MKRTARRLMIAGCLCLSFIAGCSKSNSNGLPAPAPSDQPGNTQSAAVAPTMPLAGSNDQTGDVADELHTPPKGSAERQALMDALREVYKTSRNSNGRPNRGDIIFVVNYLKVHNGWAWTYAEPQSSDPNDSFGENSGFLLHLEEGRWKVMKTPSMVNDPNDPENLDYPGPKDVERIRKMYPSISRDIFPRP